MDKRDYYIMLYDYYSSLLSDKQRDYFEDYYFNNLSLSEISENRSISRNAIHKVLDLTIDKLLFYEDKLSLYKKNNRLKNIIDKIDDEDIKKELERLI